MTATDTEQVATSHIREAAERLIAAKALANAAALVLAEHQERLRQTYAEDFVLADRAAASEKLADQQLRELTLAYHATTGERKPVPGIEVQMRQTIAFDPDVVMGWVRRTGVGLIPESYDEKIVGSLAKSAPPGTVEGVTLTSVPFVKVASDLSEKLFGGAA